MMTWGTGLYQPPGSGFSLSLCYSLVHTQKPVKKSRAVCLFSYQGVELLLWSVWDTAFERLGPGVGELQPPSPSAERLVLLQLSRRELGAEKDSWLLGGGFHLPGGKQFS